MVTASDGQREQLAAALSTTTTCHGEEWPSPFHYQQVDALLPVVQRIADQRAGDELRDAAAQIADIDPQAALWLTTRADTLDPK